MVAKAWRWISLLVSGVLLTGCNHLFYYPDSYEHLTPDKVNLRYESLTVISADQTPLHAWWIYPSTPTAKGVVIQLHGNAENMTTHFLYVGWLAENGYAVMTFDYRGYGSSRGQPDREGIVQDAVAVMGAARERMPDKPIFIVAQSLGGAIAIPALARWQGQVCALMLDSTFASYREIARDKLAGFWLTWPLQYPLSWLVSDDLSPIDDAAKITQPVLMFHGDQDRAVSWYLGRRLFDALGSTQKTWELIPNGEHTAALGMKDDRYRKQVLAFFQKQGASCAVSEKDKQKGSS